MFNIFNFPTFYMIVGIPGSGKSSFCNLMLDYSKNSVHISSDSIREELYGDESIQDNPDTVFRIMQERMLDTLALGKNVFYDATNITYKHRKAILDKIPSYVRKECFVVWAPIEECIDRDNRRGRTVGKDVIDKMLKNFQSPYYDEGYSKITICTGMGDTIHTYRKEPEYMNLNIPNDNPHHTTKTIYDHCIKCLENVGRSDLDLVLAARYHDIGKPYCKSFTNSKGEVTDVAHYYGHQGVGAWISYGISNCNEHVAWLISRHMDPYLNTKYYNNLPVFLKEEIDILHKADCEAH